MANPPDLQYCKIVGNFKAFIADGADADDLPDFVPMSGTGKLWANVDVAKNSSVGYKSTYFNTPIDLIVDLDGDLTQNGRKYAMVLAAGPGLTPVGFNYSIVLNLSAQGDPSPPRQFGPFSFDIIPGGQVDISDVLPVSSSGGVPMLQGPPGPTGATGDPGPANTLTIGTVSTLSSGTPASADITGVSPSQTLNLGIPLGPATQLSVLGTTTGTNNWTYNELRGTGMPEGVTTASTGTYYTDLNGTNGAWRWLKTSGTGNTGWKVIYGDTGWRDVSTLVKATATSITGGTILLRRLNDNVYWKLQTVTVPSTGTESFINPIPTGFAPTVRMDMSADSELSTPLFVIYQPAANVHWWKKGATSMTGTVAGLTDSAWPTALPGTAA